MSEHITLAAALERAAVRSSASKGFRFVKDDAAAEPFFSFAGVERSTARYAGALQALGLRKGDRVALVLPDPTDFVLVFLACARAGLVPVPLYPPTMTGQLAGYVESSRHIVQRSGARALVTTGRIKAYLGTLSAHCPALKLFPTIDDLRSSREELRPTKIALDDVAMLQFTSGSTARPKGVVLTHANIAANVSAFAEHGLRLMPDDVGVSWLPLYHDMGLIGFVVAPLYREVSTVLLSPMGFLKRPLSWLVALSRHKGTISYGPSFAYALTAKRLGEDELRGLDLSRWRIAGVGAEPVRLEALDAFARVTRSAGFSPSAFVPSYGLAESTLAVSFAPVGRGPLTDTVLTRSLWEEGYARPAAKGAAQATTFVRLGHAFPGHEVGVFAETDTKSERALPERRVGELRIRGPSVMSSYVDDPESTRLAFAGGWLRTGDLGYHVGGELVVAGRSKEIFILNGRNVYPSDIELAAARAPLVRKGSTIAFSVRGEADDRERLVLLAEVEGRDPADRSRTRSHIRAEVSSVLGLFVDDVVIVDAGVLPKTSSGKLQRLMAKRLYESGELFGRRSQREASQIDWARELLRSQLSFVTARLTRGR